MTQKQRVKDITVVSLSRGVLGEDFVSHEVELGVRRLEEYGVRVRFSKHALSGLDYVKKHPEKRAEDLLNALESDTDVILCAVGGDDTYRLLPYLFEDGQLEQAVKKMKAEGKEKIFLGFSDSTVNHLMLHKAGLNTFYGQAFLPDVCELDREMLPYTKKFFEELIFTGTIREIRPSDRWYSSREDFSVSAIGTGTASHENSGFELLQGASVFKGEILGGCIDTLYDLFNNERYEDSVRVCSSYGLFPERNDWKGKILLLESSEEKAEPDKYRKMLTALKQTGIFEEISGILMGKPADETYFEEYKQIIREVIGRTELPIAANISVGHALPRCIIPFGVPAEADLKEQVIRFKTGAER